jgi:hypothetical protein
MANFVLDIVLEETQFSSQLRTLRAPVWLCVAADGIRQQPTTAQVPAKGTQRFCHPMRLVLNLPALEGYYFRTRLCTYNEDGSSVRVLANSQISLARFPTGTPQMFTYPLLNCHNTAMELAIVSARAAISRVDLQACGDPRAPIPGPMRLLPAQARLDFGYGGRR